MISADWIAIAVVLGCFALGALIGFGNGVKFFSSGIFGVIISIVVCALVGTVFMEAGFIGDLMLKFRSLWEGKGGFYSVLETIHVELIVYYLVLFLIVWLLRFIVVKIISAVAKSENGFIKVINRLLGAVFFVAIGVLICLLAFKIIGWVGGDTAVSLYDSLHGSAFGLDRLFDHISPNWRG